MVVLSSVIAITGCQKPNDVDDESDIQVTKITPNKDQEHLLEKTSEINDVKKVTTTQANNKSTSITDDFEIVDGVIVNKGTVNKGTVNKATANKVGTDDIATNATDAVDTNVVANAGSIDINSDNSDIDKALSAEEKRVLLEKQITDVAYQSQTGENIKVTFQTSALETLEADVMLPSGQRVTLTAPEGQGNNPIYQSKEGNIKLVTHGGGGSVDLIYAGKQSNYDAISAEAEVVSPP